MFNFSCEAIVPYYDCYGHNACYTYHTDGTQVHHTYPVKHYIYRMLLAVHLDPKTLSHWTYSILHAKLNTPLILDEDHIYLPIKLRRSVSKSDGAMGYVLASAIAEVSEGQLTLRSGVVLPIFSSATCVSKKQKDAALLCYAYREQKKQYEFMRL